MKTTFFIAAALPLCLVSCSNEQKENEEINIENMVLNDASDAEWTTGYEEEEELVLQERDPVPQEQIIAETPDAPTKFNPTDSSR
ncbi:MAG: hypothetical protein K2X08_04430 [Chlamydiales bacterium]|nr:hypothetical protein [Chlamydiales bacterium]MBY0530192.1 hypothetical protein [Rhabdochlamydiaceae bacterium]